MSVMKNVNIYGIEESIKGSKYPMSTDIASLNTEMTKTVKKLGSARPGTGHDTFLNGIIAQFDLTFTVKAWTEAERYHFFDFVSSQSTMHRITKFDFDGQCIEYVDPRIIDIMKEKVADYNNDPSDAKYLGILYSNPTGFKLTARMTTNYRQLKTIVMQRKNHRLPEWREFCDEVMLFPNFKELCFNDSERTVTVKDISNGNTVHIEASKDVYESANRILLTEENTHYGTLYYPDGGNGE